MKETKHKEYPPMLPELARLELELFMGRFTPKEVSHALYAAYVLGRDQGWAIEREADK